MAVFAVLMRLREICCDPRLVADNWDGGSAKLDACMELVTAAVEGGHRIPAVQPVHLHAGAAGKNGWTKRA